MAKIVLFGLDNDLADQLRTVLRQQGHQVDGSDSPEASEMRSADILFAGGDGPNYRETVSELTERHPGLPLVLVNRHPENHRWLDALELGAADYCGAPFEPHQMNWLIAAVMRQSGSGITASAA
jgi:DNA-binding response OmpR family regulator